MVLAGDYGGGDRNKPFSLLVVTLRQRRRTVRLGVQPLPEVALRPDVLHGGVPTALQTPGQVAVGAGASPEVPTEELCDIAVAGCRIAPERAQQISRHGEVYAFLSRRGCVPPPGPLGHQLSQARV